MAEEFQIFESDKLGWKSSEERYIVVRNGISFLRVVGGEPCWSLMTATADEDRGHIRVCVDQRRLIESALRLCAERGITPEVSNDNQGREFVRMGEFTREAGDSDEDFQKERDAVFRRFFEIFDSYTDPGSRRKDEMLELYEALAVEDDGDDVYLSDGMWLSSDGSLHDRGR